MQGGKRAPAVPVTHYLSAEGLQWQARGENYWEAPLHADRARGERTVLMRMGPGAQFGMHAHEGEREQIYVLSGSFRDQNRTLKPGDYACREPGAPHSSDSDKGCVALLVYTRV
jgi:anti-sigma factor ChrR (cupin superfamily)